jgi:alkylation response protein AidB-like acyl-CoA dehydrogenase
MKDFELSGLTADELTFRDEVRTFYEENLTPELRRAGQMIGWTFSEFEYGRQWQQILHKRGWGAPFWPIEYGGTGWTAMQHYIFELETLRASPPSVYFLGLILCAPCIMAFGTQAQKDYFLPRIISGEDWWAQGYSEPGCGSDLASLQLKAQSDGDFYVLNGSKIWTTYAQHANRIFCLVRTSSEGKKQAGITFLLIDMDSDGIEVRPIINIAGEHEFNQVFFKDVRVPKDRRLGEENDGWKVARHLLKYEHGGGGRISAEMRRRLGWVAEVASQEADGFGGKMIDDPDFSRHLAEVAIGVEAIDFAAMQALAALRAGEAPPPGIALLRIRLRELGQRITELGMEAVGHYGAPFQPQARAVMNPVPTIGPDYAAVAMPFYLSHRAATIAGGTPEIQRNNVAKALLGL